MCDKVQIVLIPAYRPARPPFAASRSRPKRTFRRHPDPAGPALGHRLRQREDREPTPRLSAKVWAPQAELRQATAGPPTAARLLRRLAHHKATSLAEEPHGALGGHGRGAEASR